MDGMNRRSILRRSPALAGCAASLLAAPQAKRPAADRKLRVVAVGGHGDDPQTCAGGTLALFADQGHDVVGLSLTGGLEAPSPVASWAFGRIPDNNPVIANQPSVLAKAFMVNILRRPVGCSGDKSISAERSHTPAWQSGSLYVPTSVIHKRTPKTINSITTVHGVE